MRPAAKCGMTLCSKARMIAAFSATGRGRSTEPMMLSLPTSTRPMSSSALRPPITPITARRPPIASDRNVLAEIKAPQVIENDVSAALLCMTQHRLGEVLLLIVDDDVGAERRYALHFARRRRHEQAPRASAF